MSVGCLARDIIERANTPLKAHRPPCPSRGAGSAATHTCAGARRAEVHFVECTAEGLFSLRISAVFVLFAAVKLEICLQVVLNGPFGRLIRSGWASGVSLVAALLKRLGSF
eukprot:5430654-Prymnesium_polylepis.2